LPEVLAARLGNTLVPVVLKVHPLAPDLNITKPQHRAS
jgi:hypothetical protein